MKSLVLSLQKGDFLPKNIIEEYNKYYDPVIKSETKSLLSKIKSIFRFII